MPELMRGHPPGQPGPPPGGGDQRADGVGLHRHADRLAEQVDQHKVGFGGTRNGQPLELISVERLHRQEVQRHRSLPPRLGPRTVHVVAAHHVQVSPLGLTPQQP